MIAIISIWVAKYRNVAIWKKGNINITRTPTLKFNFLDSIRSCFGCIGCAQNFFVIAQLGEKLFFKKKSNFQGQWAFADMKIQNGGIEPKMVSTVCAGLFSNFFFICGTRLPKLGSWWYFWHLKSIFDPRKILIIWCLKRFCPFDTWSVLIFLIFETYWYFWYCKSVVV